MSAGDGDLELARSAPFFAGLTEPDFRELVADLSPRDYAPGARVFAEGDRCDGLYVLLDGRVEVSKRQDGVIDLTLATLEPVTVLGELSLVLDSPRHASVHAAGAARLLCIPPDRWTRTVAAGGPAGTALLLSLARTLGQRLVKVDEQILHPGRARGAGLADLKSLLLGGVST